MVSGYRQCCFFQVIFQYIQKISYKLLINTICPYFGFRLLFIIFKHLSQYRSIINTIWTLLVFDFGYYFQNKLCVTGDEVTVNIYNILVCTLLQKITFMVCSIVGASVFMPIVVFLEVDEAVLVSTETGQCNQHCMFVCLFVCLIVF